MSVASDLSGPAGDKLSRLVAGRLELDPLDRRSQVLPAEAIEVLACHRRSVGPPVTFDRMADRYDPRAIEGKRQAIVVPGKLVDVVVR